MVEVNITKNGVNNTSSQQTFVANSIADLEKFRITSKSDIPPIIPIITIRGKIYAIKGDLAAITGQAKAGKSSICLIIIVTALLSNYPSDFDSLNIKTEPSFDHIVLYVDSEQPKSFTDNFRDKIERIVGKQDLENLIIYNIRELSTENRKNFVFAIFKLYKNIHLCVIDGIADLVSSVNEVKECNEIISSLMAIASSENTTIILCLHENPGIGRQKMRGHLGSEIERKCGGTIVIKKEEGTGIHSIISRVLRADSDFDRIDYKYDEETNMLRSLNSIEIEQQNEH